MATRNETGKPRDFPRRDAAKWLDKEIEAGRISERQLLHAADKARRVRERANERHAKAA